MKSKKFPITLDVLITIWYNKVTDLKPVTLFIYIYIYMEVDLYGYEDGR